MPKRPKKVANSTALFRSGWSVTVLLLMPAILLFVGHLLVVKNTRLLASGIEHTATYKGIDPQYFNSKSTRLLGPYIFYVDGEVIKLRSPSLTIKFRQPGDAMTVTKTEADFYAGSKAQLLLFSALLTTSLSVLITLMWRFTSSKNKQLVRYIIAAARIIAVVSLMMLL